MKKKYKFKKNRQLKKQKMNNKYLPHLIKKNLKQIL